MLSIKKRYFNRIFNEIITDMENSRILYSYNIREKICLDGVRSGEIDELEIINISNKYSITSLSTSDRYTKELKDSIKKFIVSLLTDTGCIKKTLLSDIISKKIGLHKTVNSLESIDEDSQDFDDWRFKDNNLSQDQLFMIEDLKIEYKQELENFINTKSDKNLKVILAIYHNSHDKMPLEKIAEFLNLNSPTTIHNWLKKNADLLPENFIKNNIHKLTIDEVDFNSIFYCAYDLCLSALKEILIAYGLFEK